MHALLLIVWVVQSWSHVRALSWRGTGTELRQQVPSPSVAAETILPPTISTSLAMGVCPDAYINAPSSEDLQNGLLRGLVNASKASGQSQHSRPHYLFITGEPYTGTTGVLGLVSTSPHVTNLCTARTICCEGQWLLAERNLTFEDRWDPKYPTDWKTAIPIFSEFWDSSKSIFVDKSPSYLYKFSHIYEDLHLMDADLSFIYLMRSPCLTKHGKDSVTEWEHDAEVVLTELSTLRAAGARVLVLHTEELLGSPLRVTRTILDFLPELESLDPTQTGVHDAPYVGEGELRARSLADYVQSTGRKQLAGSSVTLTAKTLELMEEFGYSPSWFNESSFIQA